MEEKIKTDKTMPRGREAGNPSGKPFPRKKDTKKKKKIEKFFENSNWISAINLKACYKAQITINFEEGKAKK